MSWVSAKSIETLLIRCIPQAGGLESPFRQSCAFCWVYFNSPKNSRYLKLSCPSPLGSPMIMPWPQDGLVYHYSPVFRVKHRIWAPERGCFRLEHLPAGRPCRHSACSTVEALPPPERPETKEQELDMLLTARSIPQSLETLKNDHTTWQRSYFVQPPRVFFAESSNNWTPKRKGYNFYNLDLGYFWFSGLLNEGKIKPYLSSI